MNQRSTSTNGPPRAAQQLPPSARTPPGGETSTGAALAAVARDTLDVATELVRDSVSLARLEASRAVREMTPRIVWGAIAIICAATALVCGTIAIMIALGAIVPSIAGRLVILTAVLLLVAFFGSVRAIRSDTRSRATPASAKEFPINESQSSDEFLPPRRS